MGDRIDYYDDPAAPAANSVKPSASAFVLHNGKVLMSRRVDNGNWTMPSGAHHPRRVLEHDRCPRNAGGDWHYCPPR
jgi:hypothetical protein